MKRLRAWTRRLAGLLPSERRERELADEIESHLQMHVDEKVRSGMTEEEARRDAVLKLGGVEPTKEAWRDRSTVPVLEHLVQDLRFSVRQLARNPGFALTAVLVLSLGVAASAAIFGFVDAALIEPLPYPDPGRLVYVTESAPNIPRAALSYLDYLDWKKLNTVFTSVDVHNGRGYMLSTGTGTGMELVLGARVSAGFFGTLGIAPVIGRAFHEGEDLPGAPRTAILGHATWQNRFAGRVGVVGQVVTLSGIPHTVIGVLPREFQFAPQGRAEFWTTLDPSGRCESRRSCHNLQGVARLADGVSVEAARAEMETIAARLESQYPDSNRGQGAVVMPLTDAIVGEVRPLLLALFGAAGLLLLIACVNVASLLLVRCDGRKRELAVRGALGATRGRLIRQFAAESLVLVAGGSLAGLALAGWAMPLLAGLIPPRMAEGMPFLRDAGLSRHVLAFAAAFSAAAAVLFSIIPLVRLPRGGSREALAQGGRAAVAAMRRHFGAHLVVAELAIAMVLLVGAGLLAKSLHRLLDVELGFEPDGIATLTVSAPQARYADDAQALALVRRLVGRVEGLPGVQAVGVTSFLPVSFNGNTDWIRFVGRPWDGRHTEVNQRDVSTNYFRALRARVLSGRSFTDAEDASNPPVVVINSTLARQHFAGEDPIGKRIGDTSLSPASLKEIIGVVDDIREGPLDAEIWPAVYYPFNQDPDTFFRMVVRSTQPAESVLPAVAAAVREVDPEIATLDEATMSARIGASPSAYLRRSSAWLIGGFAAVALLLGVVGLYGVVAYSVGRRAGEIGVRMALGARRAAVYRLILSEAAWLAAAGIALGAAASAAWAALLRGLLFDTPAWDLPTLAKVAAALAASALPASYFPARRAASIDPVDALRAE